MGATYRERRHKSGRIVYIVCVHHQGETTTKTVAKEATAKALVEHIHRQELAGLNVLAAVQQARRAPPPPRAPSRWPRLREALPVFIDRMAAQGDWNGSTPSAYRRRLASHVYDFALPDGRRLGDLPVDQVTEPMIGAVLDRLRTSDGTHEGKSLAVQEQIRSPLKRFYRDLIKKQGFTLPNPAADLADYMSKYGSRRARYGKMSFFQQDEAPALFGTCEAAFPRWLAFLGCCTLAGLRWGEAAALHWEDINWKPRPLPQLHVRRTICDRTGRIELVKDKEDRYVPISGQLATWLTRHRTNVALEGQVKQWTPDQRALVFPNQRGHIGRYSAFLEHVWQPLLRLAQLRYRKFHSTRHSFASWLLEGNEDLGIKPVDIDIVREWLGHATVQETEGYRHRLRTTYGLTINNLDCYLNPRAESGATGRDSARLQLKGAVQHVEK